jgi:PKD repeat protein
MKKYILILAILPMLFASCEKEPYADFYASATLVEIDEIIYFTNNSMHAGYFEWDFGDGTISTRRNPSHHYSYEGIFTVSLTAFRNDRIYDRAYMTIEVLMPTMLEVTVLEYYYEYPVSDASVLLYPSLYDWEQQTNDIVEGFTDANGVVTFTGLDPVSYWIDVWHENYNNYMLAEEDEYWIKTLPLLKNRLNTFIAYVDEVEPPPPESFKSTGVKRDRNLKNYKIINIERTFKDKPLQGTSTLK